MKGTLTWLSVISDPPTSGEPHRQTVKTKRESKKIRKDRNRRRVREVKSSRCAE